MRQIPELQEDIANLLREYQSRTGKLVTVGTIESATGGRISDKITNVPGSSDYYKGSIISYSNEIKADVVRVRKGILKKYGAVSPQTATEMANQGKKLLRVDVCLSTTGIAGPSGATPSKPVGLFYLALSTRDAIVVQEHRFSGSREQNKQEATEMTLTLLRDYLQERLSEVSPSTMEVKHVVTCFLEHRGKILILRRSGRVGTYRRNWAGISGYIETNELDQAFSEIREEAELYKKDLRLIRKGVPLEIVDEKLNRKWVVHPFLFHVKTPEKIKTDWEHTETRWIKPQELKKYDTVPGLAKALRRVLK